MKSQLRALLCAVVALMAMVSLVGCDRTECETSENCPDGKACSVDGQCIDVACTSSLDCNIGEYCSAESGSCTAGCLNDRDCLPSLSCDTEAKQCVEKGCRSTALDCDFGEFCNTLTGQCTDAGSYYCKPCESDLDCGSSNNFCLRLNSGLDQTYCGVDCSSGQECPRGFECLRIRAAGDVTLGYQCVAACWLVGE